MKPGGAIAAISGVVAEHPQPAMADYSASKAALSAWLDAVRRETRTVEVQVLDVRFGHLDTGFADRAVEGIAPPMPAGGDVNQAVRAVAEALESGAELVRPGPDGRSVGHKRAR
ncbi:SDR family NAD(P)-dependent oxidoreductase [Streptomyces sp. CB01635]|uniref:SDR family NAD(P)-dependent oxidoreductase n=1 Tax=unclassified Streptomyces TaxID=2593676 RepID=UPI001F3FA89E|nr:SDR family NAD(P)-dependent oxidoreductase [Streptomyces sp. CB01635]